MREWRTPHFFIGMGFCVMCIVKFSVLFFIYFYIFLFVSGVVVEVATISSTTMDEDSNVGSILLDFFLCTLSGSLGDFSMDDG